MGDDTRLREKYFKAIFAIYLETQNNQPVTIQPILTQCNVGKGVGTALTCLGCIKRENGHFVWKHDKMPDMDLAKAVVDEVRRKAEEYKKNKERAVAAKQDFNNTISKVPPTVDATPITTKVVPFQQLLPVKMSRTTDDFLTSTVLSFMSRVESQNEAILSVMKGIKGLLEDIKKGQQEAAATASLSSHEESQQLTAAM